MIMMAINEHNTTQSAPFGFDDATWSVLLAWAFVSVLLLTLTVVWIASQRRRQRMYIRQEIAQLPARRQKKQSRQ